MKRCLIIDDSSVIRKVAKRILNDQSLRVLEAESGLEGLAKCRAELPEYVIIDATLPDLSVIEFLTSLRGIARENMPCVLILLNELDIVPIMKAKRAGAAGFLLKPFDRRQLTAKFEEYRRKHEQTTRAA